MNVLHFNSRFIYRFTFFNFIIFLKGYVTWELDMFSNLTLQSLLSFGHPLPTITLLSSVQSHTFLRKEDLF